MYKSNKYKEQDVVPNTFRSQVLRDKKEGWFTMLFNNGNIPLHMLIKDLERCYSNSPRFKFRIIDCKTCRVVYE